MTERKNIFLQNNPALRLGMKSMINASIDVNVDRKKIVLALQYDTKFH